ncbi:MAG: transcriptional repressor LexA [candidate division Zixibacteria bacterium]|nr:transcriptional repressor LexA [candidate division Zixibacteria bacterium]
MAELLTNRQRQILEYISDMINRKGFPPTIREIGDRFRFKSTNATRSVLAALSKKGYIKRRPLVSRGIELLRQTKASFSIVPLIGRVSAGIPILAVENIEGNFAVDKSFLPDRESFFLKVVGDSMKDAGILDGDYVLAQSQDIANKGDIVVAIIGDEANVKKYFPEKNKVRLEPANSQYGPIIVEKNTPDFRIAGKVVGLLRRM